MEDRPVGPVERDEPLGGLAKRLVEDLSTLARDHVDLARVELSRGLKRAAGEAIGFLVGAMVALIGFGMACAAVVPALEPVVAPLWARLLIAAAIFLVVGGVVTGALLARLKRDVPPELPRTKGEARETVHRLKEQVQHG